mgnify:CR=1 FL=1
MEQWKEYKLSDILSIVSGFAYKGEYLGKGESLLLGMGCVLSLIHISEPTRH